MWPSYLQTLPFEVDTIESHGLCGLINGSELQECKVFVQIYLARENWVAGGLCQAREMHLLIEKLHGLFFSNAEWNVADVQSSRLTRNSRAYDRHGCLRGVGDDISWNLARRLHSLVLQRRNVLESWWRHIPIQRRLATTGSLVCRIWRL